MSENLRVAALKSEYPNGGEERILRKGETRVNEGNSICRQSGVGGLPERQQNSRQPAAEYDTGLDRGKIMTGNCEEDKAVECLYEKLKDKLPNPYKIAIKARLQYYCAGLKITPCSVIKHKETLKDNGEHNKSRYFQTDILIYEEGDLPETRIPRVVTEVKNKCFSTHDVITYGKKASKHKILYPYLQYGFLVYNPSEEELACRFLYHGDEFDFACMYDENKDFDASIFYENIIKPAIINSKRLEFINNKINPELKNTEDEKILWYRKDFILPQYEDKIKV